MTISISDDQAVPKEMPCPICRKPAVEAYRPFCSKRCADVDLHRWFNGTYSLPAAPDEEEWETIPEDELLEK